MGSWTRHFRFAGAVAMACAGLCGPARSSAAELPESVLQALSESAGAFAQIQVEYQWHRTTALPSEQIQDVLKVTPGRPEFFGNRDVRYIRQGRMIYAFLRELVQVTIDREKVEVRAYEQERAFNGRKVFDGTGETAKIDNNSMLHIYDAGRWANSRPERRFADSLYFTCAGFRVPDTNAAVVAQEPPKSRILYLLNNKLADLAAIRSESSDGSETVQVEIQDFDFIYRFVLDPALNYAVRSFQEMTAGRKLLAVTENSDFQQLGSSPVWLPKACRVDHFSPLQRTEPVYDAPIYSDVITVRVISDEPVPEERFTLQYKPGTWITDQTFDDSGDTVTYQMPADPSQLDEVIRTARLGLAARAKSYRTRLIMLAANLLVLAVLGGIWIWRLRRARNRSL